MNITTGKRSRVRASTTTKTYAYCRNAAREALERAKSEKSGSFYFYMMAATFATFTVEAYLNHLGGRKTRDWGAIERRLGPKEKLLVLRQILHLEIDESRRPFQTLRDMLRLRDALAHGRTLDTSSDVIVDETADEAVFYPQPEWKQLCQPTSAARMVEDAGRMVSDLSAQAGFKGDPFGSPGSGWYRKESAET
jgi:hypothetical protein